jgi:hypothetical protein
VNVKRVGRFLLAKKLYGIIIIIIFVTGFIAGFTTSQAIQDPTNYFAIFGSIISILSSAGSMWKLFSDHRKSMNIPSLEYGELYSHANPRQEMMGTRNNTLFLLPVREVRGLGQKVNDCEAFMDIPQAGIIHRTLYWRNGNKPTISIGLKEELQLFTFSSFINADNIEIKKKLLFNVADPNGHLTISDIPFETIDTNNEVIINMQVGQGGAAPSKPYKTTIKQILETGQ